MGWRLLRLRAAALRGGGGLAWKSSEEAGKSKDQAAAGRVESGAVWRGRRRLPAVSPGKNMCCNRDGCRHGRKRGRLRHYLTQRFSIVEGLAGGYEDQT